MATITKAKLRTGEIRLGASEIVDLLATKHAEDVFVPECKDGPTWNGQHMRMDAWAMKKSWSNPLSVAYEVKVSRSDFLGDDKWQGYLACCNELYFVCPSGLIRAEELPAEAGLIYVSATGSRLFTKKKSPWRDVRVPEELYRYVLMSRVRVLDRTERYAGRGEKPADFWRRWLEERTIDHDFGWRVGRAIRETMTKRITEVESRMEGMSERMATYDKLKDLLCRLGVDPDRHRWGIESDIERKVRALRDLIPEDVRKSLDKAAGHLQDLLEKLKVHERMEGGTPDGHLL